MSASLNIHRELQSIKAHRLPRSRWVLAASQTFLAAVNTLHRRKYKSVLTRIRITSSDDYRTPALIIRPENLPSAAPALVYFHGGAFVMKPAPQHVENALRYAREAQCVVVFVEYRLAPKYRFPAGFNDCYAALRWTLSTAAECGIDTMRVAVGGDSAGGSLAAGVAQRARHEDDISLRGQMLLYPAVDLLCKRPSMTAYADVPPFDDLSSSGVAEMYVGPEVSQKVPAYASPLFGDLSQLAPAYVETPQFDPLHDQGHAYAEALTAKGVNVELNEIEGGVHGFDLLAASSSVAKDAMRRRIDFLRRAFAIESSCSSSTRFRAD